MSARWIGNRLPEPEGSRAVRFRCIGGDVIELETGRPIMLATAKELASAWGLRALAWENEGRRELARIFARDALDIGLAASAAIAWRKCAGPREATNRG